MMLYNAKHRGNGVLKLTGYLQVIVSIFIIVTGQ